MHRPYFLPHCRLSWRNRAQHRRFAAATERRPEAAPKRARFPPAAIVRPRANARETGRYRRMKAMAEAKSSGQENKRTGSIPFSTRLGNSAGERMGICRCVAGEALRGPASFQATTVDESSSRLLSNDSPNTGTWQVPVLEAHQHAQALRIHFLTRRDSRASSPTRLRAPSSRPAADDSPRPPRRVRAR